MTTCTAFEPTSADLTALTEVPQQHYEPKPTPYSTALRALGFPGKGLRAELDGTIWNHYKNAEESWRECTSNAMLRTMPHYAAKLAKQQFEKYLPFGDLINTLFATITFQFSAPGTDSVDGKGFAAYQTSVRSLRSLIDQLLPKSIDKLGTTPDGRKSIKVLFASNIDAPALAELRSSAALLAEQMVVTAKNHYKADYQRELQQFLLADLPSSEVKRACFEAALEDIHQLVVHKVSREERSKYKIPDKFVLETLPSTNLEQEASTKTTDVAPFENFSMVLVDAEKDRTPIYVPRGPKFKNLATHVAPNVHVSVRNHDIAASDWIALPVLNDDQAVPIHWKKGLYRIY